MMADLVPLPADLEPLAPDLEPLTAGLVPLVPDLVPLGSLLPARPLCGPCGWRLSGSSR
jgi:hypothetical protein